MTTSVFTVFQNHLGWAVSEGERIAEVFSSKFWALKGADALAHERHRGTGHPAFVVLQYSTSCSIVASRYE